MMKPFFAVLLTLTFSFGITRSAEIGAAIEVTESNWESLITEGNHEWMIEL